MKPLHTFHVGRRLPLSLSALGDIADNLRWSWDRQTQDLFRWIDPALWEETDQNALRVLERVSSERLDDISTDSRFTEFLKKVENDLALYLNADSWFQARKSSPLKRVAYFSPEFGISSALPQYSGGLGVLAGDHLKSASALGVPIVGVGLFYKEGYFRQSVTPRGSQFERYPTLDPLSLGLTKATEPFRLLVGDQEAKIEVWSVSLGRVRIYLLDTDNDENPPELRQITDRLYGGDIEHRIRQEIVLGMGGVKALRAVGESIQVFHSNEGHAGFMGLERVQEMVDSGLGFVEAIETVRSSSIFTTHTPVPAGIDRFPYELIERYFAKWAANCGVSLDDLMQLGHVPGESADQPFNMAVMGMHLSSMANGVSKLHGEVSRSLFSAAWPDLNTEQIPITHVTNGVHPSTWVSGEMAELYSTTIHPNWANGSKEEWEAINSVPDATLWQLREASRSKMIPEVRRRLRSALIKSGWEEANVSWCDTVLDPRALTVGFARRFAPYKRADLLLSQAERLITLCNNEDRPVQFIFAGKAHPADDPGKDLVRRVFEFSFTSGARGRFVFVPDYDMSLARTLYQGCDIWLNTPIRPLEASGTSGMKAALNGCVNLSILDGWWAECQDGDNGWAISSAPDEYLEDERVRLEADSLFSILEGSAVPEFYDRDEELVPQRWMRRVKASLSSLGPVVSGHRMVREYVEKMYEPTAQRSSALGASTMGGISEIVNFKTRVRAGWPGTVITSVERRELPSSSTSQTQGFSKSEVTLTLLSPTLDAKDLVAEVIWGPVGSAGAFKGEKSVLAELLDEEIGENGRILRFRAVISPDSQGSFGFLTSVRPSHPLLSSSFEMGLQLLA